VLKYPGLARRYLTSSGFLIWPPQRRYVKRTTRTLRMDRVSTGVPYHELEKEFERVGVDENLRSGLSTTDPRPTLELLLAALRATPTGTGTLGFKRTLRMMLEGSRCG
jgi:hypothetical protein